jgi:hypothetical protein
LGRQGEVVSKYGYKREPLPERRLSPANQVKTAAREKLRQQVLELSDSIFDRYVEGESFDSIAKSLPFKIAGHALHRGNSVGIRKRAGHAR